MDHFRDGLDHSLGVGVLEGVAANAGAGGPGYREKDIVLATSGLVASELQRRGIQAVATRSSDVFIELSDRPAIAAKRGADAFVSIHANSPGDGRPGRRSNAR